MSSSLYGVKITPWSYHGALLKWSSTEMLDYKVLQKSDTMSSNTENASCLILFLITLNTTISKSCGSHLQSMNHTCPPLSISPAAFYPSHQDPLPGLQYPTHLTSQLPVSSALSLRQPQPTCCSKITLIFFFFFGCAAQFEGS